MQYNIKCLKNVSYSSITNLRLVSYPKCDKQYTYIGMRIKSLFPFELHEITSALVMSCEFCDPMLRFPSTNRYYDLSVTFRIFHEYDE